MCGTELKDGDKDKFVVLNIAVDFWNRTNCLKSPETAYNQSRNAHLILRFTLAAIEF